jgi:MoaA/NifB/PqqE/SkfB family radical SAM enzyme
MNAVGHTAESDHAEANFFQQPLILACLRLRSLNAVETRECYHGSMNLWERTLRHARLSVLAARSLDNPPSPPFFVLFINSICNQSCEHCFFWRSLNQKDDLSVEEIRALSEDMGPIENLNLSGGEPFLRKEFGEICRMFIRNNGVKQIYVPTNGSFAEKTVQAIEEVLKESSLYLFAVELSLDGMPEFHDRFRGMKDAFHRAMETYDALVELRKRDPRLHIHGVSTATADNLDELRRLTEFLNERCPEMEHHGIAMITGDRKNASLEGPSLEKYRELYEYSRGVWASRDKHRYGSIVEPMLQHAKLRTLEEKRQVVGCKAGILTGVVYANGDVSLCQTHAPLANLRRKKFSEIWNSDEARVLRKSIAARDCWCTNEVFMWPNIVFQPMELAKSLVQVRPWRTAEVTPGAAPREPASEGRSL